MKPNTLLLLGAGVVAYLMFGNKASQRRYNAGLRIQIVRAEIVKGKLELELNFQNVNSQPVTLKSAYGEVSVNNTKLGRFKLEKTIVLQGNAETVVPVQVELKLSNTIQALSQLTAGIANSVITVTGNINVSDQVQPLFIQYRINA